MNTKNSNLKLLWTNLIILLIGYNFLTFIINKIIITEDLYYYSFGKQLSEERIEQLFSFKSRLEWLYYIIIPFFLIIKLGIITIVLYIGVILSNLKVKFKSIFQIVLKAEFIFLLALFIKFYWMYLFMDNLSITSLNYFQPLSITNFFSSNDISSWMIYPLNLLNLFELGYWFLLAYLLMDIIKKSFWKSLEFVLSTYGVALLIWVVFVVFLTLNFSS